MVIICRASTEHPEMPQVVLLLKMPCDIHDPLHSPSHEQDPRKRNAPLSRVLRAAPLMLSEQSKILTSTEKLTTSRADPPDRGPHRTQARGPLCPVLHLPAILKIPAVSSGATWTLQLRNFLRTCITQGQSTFATP